MLPYPEETPFSFAETYQDQAHPDPAYGEHFAVGDVPAGDLVDTTSVGTHSFTVYAEDRAGHSRLETVNYEIVSAGPDRKHGTDDDIRLNTPAAWRHTGWWSDENQERHENHYNEMAPNE